MSAVSVREFSYNPSAMLRAEAGEQPERTGVAQDQRTLARPDAQFAPNLAAEPPLGAGG